MCKLCGKGAGGGQRARKVALLAHKIIAGLKPEKLILFGSFARGDSNESSDADFIVVADFKEPFFDRIGRVLEMGDGSIGVDALAYTPREFAAMVARKNPFIMRALKEGIVLN